ncbi:MAG: hypothetical protein AAGA54_30170 [Myxococcota bacterium]
MGASTMLGVALAVAIGADPPMVPSPSDVAGEPVEAERSDEAEAQAKPEASGQAGAPDEPVDEVEPAVDESPPVVETTAAAQPSAIPIQRPRAAREAESVEPPAPVDEPAEPVHATPSPFDPMPTASIDDGEEAFVESRPPPPPGIEVTEDEPERSAPPPPPPNSNLAWGRHKPVARWKRVGLIASGATTGAALVGGIISSVAFRRAREDLDARQQELSLVGTPIEPCPSRGGSTGSVMVADVESAQICRRGQNAALARNASVVVGTLGALSTVTFGVLHLVRRTDVPPARARVRPTGDGVAVRF